MQLNNNVAANLSRFVTPMALLMALLCFPSDGLAQQPFELKNGDHICYIGNTTADRMQHHGWLETYLHALHPQHQLTFRNLGFSGDELVARPRSANFGSPDQWLTKCEADVVFCFFGYNEALRGSAGLASFEQDLAELIQKMRKQKYNGESAPRLVFFSPIAHENLNDPNLPDGSANNRNLKMYSDAMEKVCRENDTPFVDLFSVTQTLYKDASSPLTMNGIHLLDRGNRELARSLAQKWFAPTLPSDTDIAKLREAVLEKNYHWFSRYRVVDGFNVFGGRSKLEWFGQSNADVMRREMDMFDVMTVNRDQLVWSRALGNDMQVSDDNIPEELIVKRNKTGPLVDGGFPYLGGEEAIEKMTVHEGMSVNLFASEEKFPRLVNPVQMAVDTDSRIWVASWESYPHWNPSQPRKDSLLIFPDEDGDGVADECKVFADELNSVTGFEFWGGGVLVAAPPEIWFLKDTDGDDVADFKLRVLQGISSADTHHSANAMLIGPDGWLYFSRGIFNVANFETPTKTYRSGKSGVHRFNPRTYEVEFHFPIGPNPHGDVFDQWGYQFANDGTSGTGSYINIGNGVGNKQWFVKRVRPVAANGILSSSHFPPENNGNFLFTNVIGFLGVLQHKVNYNGADITCEEIEPIVFSEDPNFRPSDLEIGGDGALYIADWHNALIGHMQHNMRDPNRDHTHGRIYRVTHNERPLLKPVKMKGKPIAQVLTNLFALENGTRYRTRLELSGRPTDEVVAAVKKFAESLNPANVQDVNNDGAVGEGNANEDVRNEAQALLECLWILEEHRRPDFNLVAKTFEAEEPRIRAAAIRTLGHWSGQVQRWEPLLLAAARDESALVRAEAVKAAVEFDDDAAVEAVFEAGTRSIDPEMATVLKYARKQMKLDQRLAKLLAANKTSPAARAYVLKNGSVAEILKLQPAEDAFQTVLTRVDANRSQLAKALDGLAQIKNQPKIKLLLETINQQTDPKQANLVGLGSLLAEQPVAEMVNYQSDVEALATTGATESLRQIGFANWITMAGPDDAFLAATENKERLTDFLNSIPMVPSSQRAATFGKVQPLIYELPSGLGDEGGSGGLKNGIEVGYLTPNTKSAMNEVVDQREVLVSKVVNQFELMVPPGQTRDKFVNVFQSNLVVSEAGVYQFFISSDDGSTLYLDDKLLINNDGDHGMSEKRGKVNLKPGRYPIRVNYFNSGGGNGLRVAWSGPGFKKQPIAIDRLFVGTGDNLHDVAVRALGSIPDRDAAKFKSLAKLIALGRNQASAISAISKIKSDVYVQSEIPTLLFNIIGYLSEMPARFRTGPAAVEATELARTLASRLPAKVRDDAMARLKNLDVRVIAIGTVPHRMIFDKEMLVVESGKTVEFRFSNVDSMPHNFAIVQPGSLEEVGELAEATGRDADAAARQYIPVSDKVLMGSKLLQSGEEQAITFEVPTAPGIYPYVCTYPGHWRRMYGALYVVPSFEAYQANSEEYLAKLDLPIKDTLLATNTRGQEWKYDDLASDIASLKGRSFEVGKAAFTAANCVACHKFGGQGVNFGPDLNQLDAKKKTPSHILRSLLEPSKDVDEKFASTTFLLDSGKTITGMITEESGDVIKIVIDPLAKDKETLINADEVEDSMVSKISPMPEGMVDKLSREEILDLIAYILSGADEKNDVFEEHHGH
ncbi:MAG: PVC-type heme-binding CxxCH protein [Planctomycetota bacterium]